MEKPNYRLTKYTQAEVEATGEARILASLSLKNSKGGIEERSHTGNCSCDYECDSNCNCDNHKECRHCKCVDNCACEHDCKCDSVCNTDEGGILRCVCDGDNSWW